MAAEAPAEPVVPGKLLVNYFDIEFWAQVVDTGEGVVLWWTDHVANEWRETYPKRAAAFARLGLLIDAVDRDAFFASSNGEWHHRWEAFAQMWAAFAEQEAPGHDTEGA